MITRRQLIAGSALGAAAAPAILRAQPLFAAYPFALGVASGDPSADGFVIWTRLAPDPLGEHGGMPMAPVPVSWLVASDERMRTVVAKGETVARPELAHSVHVEVGGLAADRPYWYLFTAGGERSTRGRARTLPAPGARTEQVRFAVAGCQHYEHGFYGAYRHLAGEEIAFLYHYGDYIYEGRGNPVAFDHSGRELPLVRRHIGQALFDLADYRRRYAQVKLDRDLQRAHEATPWWVTFDDHEVADNWAAEIDGAGRTPPELFRLRRAAAFQAWYEHMPVRAASLPGAAGLRAHRAARYGDLLQASFLDTRQYRTDQPCGDGIKPGCPDVESAQAEILGREQEAWLAATLARDARWNLIAQQVMMMAVDRRSDAEPEPVYNLDSWAGYRRPRSRMLERMRGRNAIVLSGDEHRNVAGLVGERGMAASAVEFVATSISSGGDGSDLRPSSDRLLANNPELSFLNDQRGYLICTVDRESWRTRYMVMDRVTDPAGRIAKRAEFAVNHGETALHAA